MLRNPLAYEGEWGFAIQINTDFDATGYSPTFMFQKPDGTRESVTAAAVTTLADGDFDWTVTDGFLTQGRWTVQAVLTAGSSVLKSPIIPFTIGPPNSATP